MKKNKLLILGGVAALIVLLALGAWLYQRENENKDLVLQKDPGLTTDEKGFYNDRIAQLEQNFNNKELSDEERFQTHLSVGANYVLIGEFNKAKQHFEEATKLMPENIVPYKELLILGGKMKDRAMAEKYTNKLIELDPANKDLYQQMYSEIQ
jgi:tetratricopeptide (TPR) repeat protein